MVAASLSWSCDAGLHRSDVSPAAAALTCRLDAGRVSNRGDWMLPGVPPSLAVHDSGAAVAWVRTQEQQILLAGTSNASAGFLEESATAVAADLMLPYRVEVLPSATGFTLLWFDQRVHLLPLDPAGLTAGATVTVDALPGGIIALAAATDGVAVLLSSALGAAQFARIDASGGVIPGAVLASDATTASLTAIDDGFAAAWAAKGDGQMHFARLDSAGNLMAAPVIVGSAPFDGTADNPRLLSRNANERLELVWSEGATTRFARLDAAGGVIGQTLGWAGLLAGAAATATGVGVLSWSWDDTTGSRTLRFTRVDDMGAGVGSGIVPVDTNQMGFGLSFAAGAGGFALAWGDRRTDGALKIISCGTRPCSQFWGEGSTQPPPPDVVQTSYVPQVFSGWLACD